MVHGVPWLDCLGFLAVSDRVPKSGAGSLHDGVEAIGADGKNIGVLEGLLICFTTAENAKHAIGRAGCQVHVDFDRAIIEGLFREKRVGIEVGFVEQDSIFTVEITELRLILFQRHPTVGRL